VTSVRCPTLRQLPSPPPGKTGWPWTQDSPQLPDARPDGQTWPRLSIVTPSYNQGRFIEETIRSVLLQGYPNLEYLVIDGGSDDESLEIIRKYEPWLAYWLSEPDRGQAHAINKGWERATGDIVAYINTDDFYLAGAFAIIAQEFCANPTVGMVYGTALIVDEQGKPLKDWEARPFDVRVMLTVGSIIPQPAVFFSKTALNTLGYLDERWHQILDYEFCIRVGMRYPSLCVARTLARFRNHPASKTRLRFEQTARELIDFVTNFNADQFTARELSSIKRTALSRVYYELALGYAEQEQRQEPEVLKPLVKSIGLEPRIALRQPMLTAHIGKMVLIGYLKATTDQVRNSVKRTAQ
jgi:glycosyltransferase involved in cell wall biosynthesis